MYDDNTFSMLKTASERAFGNKKWFIELEDWTRLGNQNISICDDKQNVLFVLNDSSVELANYICLLNNVFQNGMKE